MRLAVLLILSCPFLSCESQNFEKVDCFQPNKTDTVFIGYEPINIDKINSEYDDYKSYEGAKHPDQATAHTRGRYAQLYDRDDKT